MDMAGTLRSRLLAAATVTNAVEQRVTWVERPQAAALPAITLQNVSEQRAQTMAGFDGLSEALVQVDVWALSYAETKAIAETVIAAIVPEATVNGIKFARSFIDGMRDLGERVETQFIHRTSIDFRIHYSIT